MITHSEGVVVEEVAAEDVEVMMDMTITIETNMKEVAEAAEETGEATGAGAVVTEVTGAGVVVTEVGVGIEVVVEAEVDTKMTTHNEDVGVEEVVEDVGVIMTVMMITITAMAIKILKHLLLYNTRYALICLFFDCKLSFRGFRMLLQQLFIYLETIQVLRQPRGGWGQKMAISADLQY